MMQDGADEVLKHEQVQLESNESFTLEWVPALFAEWGDYDATNLKFISPPSWVDHYLPNRTEYQRLNTSLPHYVPNHMNEVGVYLHHIVHRYHALADVTLFSQGDIAQREAQSARCHRGPGVAWAPLPNAHYFMRGQCHWWDDSRDPASMYKAAVQQCFLNIATAFGIPLPRNGSTFECPHFYIQNKFFVARATIQRISLATWRRVYRTHIVHGTCHSDGLVNRSFVSQDAWARHHKSNLTAHNLMRPDRCAHCPMVKKKAGNSISIYHQEMGASWEFISNAVFGGQPFVSTAWSRSKWCNAFRPGCGGASPCEMGRSLVV
jgi:hypothetical protein